MVSSFNNYYSVAGNFDPESYHGNGRRLAMGKAAKKTMLTKSATNTSPSPKPTTRKFCLDTFFRVQLWCMFLLLSLLEICGTPASYKSAWAFLHKTCVWINMHSTSAVVIFEGMGGYKLLHR